MTSDMARSTTATAVSLDHCVSNHPFVPLRRRPVRLLWSAAVISDAGTWVQLIVVGSLVAATTGSAGPTGLGALANLIPPGIAAAI